MADGRNLLDTAVGIASLAGLLAGGIWYATGLQNQLDTAQRELSDLRSKLDAVSAINSSAKGPKGDQGEAGPPGQKGAKGDQGEVGPPGRDGISTIDPAHLEALVDASVTRRLATLPTSPNVVANGHSTPSSTSLFDTSKCVLDTEVKSMQSIVVRSGMQF